MKNIFGNIFGADAKKRVVELEAALEALNADLSQTQKLLADEEAKARGLEETLAQTERDQSEKAKEFSEIEETKNAAIETLNIEIAELKKLIEGAEAAGTAPGSVLDSFRARVEEKEKQVIVLEDEIKKSRRRIEELEDDIDDTKDDLKKTKKKLEDASSEKNALEHQFEEIKTEHAKIQGELESAKTNLQITESDLKLKKSSINFVNEILNAKGASNTRTVEIAQKTDEIRYFVEDSVCEIFREGYEQGKEIADGISEEIWKWVNLQKKTWLKDKVIIAFIGEFSAGKTSIVNRIFTHDDPNPAYTLPTDRAATTAVATYISYGKSANVHFTDPVGELREMPRKVFLQFTKESLDNISVSRLVSHFVTEFNNKNLERLSILDTPGFSSGDPEDEARTTAVIHEADAVFWVVDANTGDINTKSLSVINEHIADIPLYVVINKVDSKSPGEREQIEKKMRSTIEKEKIPVRGFIQFSKKEPLDALAGIINGLSARNPGYDVIADIQERFDDLSKHYKKQIAEAKKIIQEKDREISEAESVIDAHEKKFERQSNRWYQLRETLFSDDNKTFWRGGVKKDVVNETYSNMVDNVNKMLELHAERAEALESRAFALSNKIKAENIQTENKEKQNRLLSVKREFSKKIEEYNTIRS